MHVWSQMFAMLKSIHAQSLTSRGEENFNIANASVPQDTELRLNCEEYTATVSQPTQLDRWISICSHVASATKWTGERSTSSSFINIICFTQVFQTQMSLCSIIINRCLSRSQKPKDAVRLAMKTCYIPIPISPGFLSFPL